MAKGKDSKLPTKQSTLNSFFIAPKGKEPSSDVEMPTSDQADDTSDVESSTEKKKAKPSKTTTKRKAVPNKEKGGKSKAKDYDDEDASDDGSPATKYQAGKGIAYELPPMHYLPTIFSDLIDQIPQIQKVAQHVQGRKLRVATMCSGTESPLLALNLIRKSILEKYDINLDVEHVFSCEIEPFKQAYIERNFHPPLLFRDVCELGSAEATTAYGSKEAVPGNVDLLIAGTSCVDYSNLNNEKQEIDANGESGRTFRGMLSWVKNHRPPIVILENVCSAPWQRVVGYFKEVGYSAEFTRVDTKNFYIPHTRTRVYLVAVDEKKSDIPDAWKDWVTKKLKRQASSTLDAFLLPSDDPRIHQARQKLVQESYNALDRRTGRTDWGRCESRHQRARLEELLGSKRPLTSWDEGGFCKLPDFAWSDWGVGQVERVWDLMDISLLRSAKTGVDPSYKTQVWNLSQNVDRNVDNQKLGLSMCLTPSMIPYITNRGGPMVGLEALSMQGLPIDELLLTRETEDQLADLAGNAMSTTVVGACILAALVVSKNLLPAGPQGVKAEKVAEVDEVMDVDPTIEEHILGEDQLLQKPLDLSVTNERSLPEILANAEKSARLCECEGRKDTTDRQVLRCLECGSSCCKKCAGRPEHNLAPIDVATHPRLSASTFNKELKSTLPMCLTISNVTQELLNELKDAAAVVIPDKRWTSWTSAVLRTTIHELRFVEPKRQDVWSAVYASPTAFLELVLHPQQPEWRLYAKAEETEPANSEIRHLLEQPVARFSCVGGLLRGRWDFALPHTMSIPITIEGAGELVPSWEARLGLMAEEFKDRVVHSQLKITVPSEDISKFDRDISGTYMLLDKCGTANSALHRKLETEEEKDLPPLFMLMDPTRCGQPSLDCFVVSISKRRYEYGESRPIVCKLDSKWRQSSVGEVEKVTCQIPVKWVSAKTVALQPSHGQDALFSVPGPVLDVSASHDACRSANALLVCRVPLRSQAGPEWELGSWKEVDKVHERGTFKALAWLLERIRHVGEHFNSWQDVKMPGDHCNCERCAPTAPRLEWKHKKKWVAMEDPVQAGEYERRLKSRPSPFVTQLKLDENGTGTVRIGINIPSLLHRALSRLPTVSRTDTPAVSWRLNTDFTPVAKLHLPKFRLSSNKHDVEHAQPPSFKIPLRVEQLRSLEWMLQQEKCDAVPFVEEEVSETILEPLGWRAEGRAQRTVHVRGGVLADQVGYGKTAITLGLIDCTAKNIHKEFSDMDEMKGKIAVRATLVVVPSHLTRQWATEVKKFTGSRFKVVTLATAAGINKITIEDIQEADIVVVASTLFRSEAYLANLESLAGAGPLPTQDGRYFNARLVEVLASLRKQVDLLRDQGAVSVMKEVRNGRKRYEDAQANILSPTKRLKGKAYREAAGSSPSIGPIQVPIGGKAKAINGLIPEVYIDNLRLSSGVSTTASSAAPSSAAEETVDEEVDSDLPSRKPRRVAAQKASHSLADEESESSNDAEEEKPKASRKTTSGPGKSTSKSTSKKKAYVVSDDDEYSAEETASDEGSEADSAVSSDDEASKRKAKAAKPKMTKKRKMSTETDVDAMDVDEPPSKSAVKKLAKTKKSDTEGDEPPAKKQKQRREDTDPWKLESNSVKKDWTQMRAPPLEMFHFARKVVDEYTYLDGKILSMVTNINADRHWVLSGTPPIHDFGALKTIAAFLNLHLGVDDDAEGQSTLIKKRRREQTAVEKFHSFREVHSLEWHANRHALGQTFLDRFVRQNIAEIDEIPWTDKLEKVVLPAAERAIYLELEHHLRALDMTIKRGKRTESDREKRLAKSMGESSTAEEALLKRCSHFDLETSDLENAMKACDVIVRERQKQLDDCKKDLLRALKEGVKTEKQIGHTSEESMFQEYVRVCRTEGVGDKDASADVNGLLDEAGVAAPRAVNGDGSKTKGKGKTKDEEKIPTKTKDLMWTHREKTHDIRRITKELVGRVRSLRYFTVVRDIQKQADAPPVISCPACKRENLAVEDAAVLSSCGHMGCLACVKMCAEKEECVYAADGSCKSAARVLNVVKADTLGVDDIARDGKGKHFGKKLERVVQLIKKELPDKERILIFVQFPDLMKKVAEALTANKIKFLEIKGTATQKSKNLELFQNESDERVLLLNVMDESASGANLTGANHAIFLSPLLAPTQEIYDACETQAIGRLRRYGQTKHVNVWRFLTTNTIDEEIFEQRTSSTKQIDVDET